MRVTFIGAAQEVTGSCFLVEAEGVRFLVDCGMFQGGREARARNLDAWHFDPQEIDFVLLTHAHIDHCGLLPRLSALGFKGPVHTTAATADLLSVMLPDSAFIQESDWARAQRKARRHGRSDRAHRDRARGSRPDGGLVLPPLYTVAQAEACLAQVRGIGYDEAIDPHPSVRCRFRDAGHILGSAILEVDVTERARSRRLVFSGDLGQPGRPVVGDPTVIESADVLIVESTYANRLHRPMNETIDELIYVIEDTHRRRQGNIVIPAFALGRTQELLWLLVDLCRQGRLPRLQVFVDSPMAARVTELTWKHTAFLDAETRSLLSLRSRVPEWLDLHFTASVEESMSLNRIKAGALIVAASGMCDAGRIRHHLRHNLGRSGCSVVIIGYQAEGTLGRRLVDGAKSVRILGEEISVRAEIHTIGGLSAHADQAALLGWLGAFRQAPSRTFVVHGEREIACEFADRIAADLGWTVEAPAPGTRVNL